MVPVAKLNKAEIEIILKLSDDKGHPEWELAESLKQEKSNISATLKDLKEYNIVYNETRQVENTKRNEYPCFIIKDINILTHILCGIQNYRDRKVEKIWNEIKKLDEDDPDLKNKSVSGLKDGKGILDKHDRLLEVFLCSDYMASMIKDMGLDIVYIYVLPLIGKDVPRINTDLIWRAWKRKGAIDNFDYEELREIS